MLELTDLCEGVATDQNTLCIISACNSSITDPKRDLLWSIKMLCTISEQEESLWVWKSFYLQS